MSKRAHNNDDTRPPKRPKPDHTNHPVEEIQFARQLEELLTFRQDGIQQLRGGIASCKALLESICYHKDEDSRPRQLSILHEFLDNQKPADANDTEHPFLGQLWQAWSFANQNNNDYLCSSISAIFALLIRTLSSILDFRDHGILLCRTVLQHQHLRLIKRSLDAPKNKDFLISPCLRLLIEVTSFDGGVLAKEVYRRREQTFDPMTLRRNLAVVKPDQTEEEAKRRPAVRTLTVRYILAHLKYLHEGGKVDLLKSRPLCTSLFHFLRDDPAEVVVELLSVTEQYVLKDDSLPRSAKAALLVEHNLERVSEIATRSSVSSASAETAFAWLKAVCSKPSYGILRTSGWYPPGTASLSATRRKEKTIDLGLDSVDFYDRDDRPNIRNTVLLSWLLTLRPHSNLQERELMMICFKSAPELVTAYFAEKNMQLEPKLTNTWIGYASFLFEVVQLSVPSHLGHEEGWAQLPPQTYIVSNSLLPPAFTQKILTRCLNQSSDLIRFFAIRILVLALEKLSEVKVQFSKGATATETNGELWQEATERLHSAFFERVPAMKDIITAFRKLPNDSDHLLQQECALHLLRLYCEVFPLQAAAENFDVSVPLTDALMQDGTNVATEEGALRSLRLQHLLQIARHSAGMRWLSKQGALEYSPIVTLLQIHAKNVQDKQIRDLLFYVLQENHIVDRKADLDALVALLHLWPPTSVAVPTFLDDCFDRVSRKPVKYLDDLEELEAKDRNGQQPSRPLPCLLVAVLLEQAPYVANKPQDEKAELIPLINNYFELLLCTEEPSELLRTLHRSTGITESLQSSAVADLKTVLKQVQLSADTIVEAEEPAPVPEVESTVPFSPPPTESENHPELLRWSKKDLALALEDGDVAALIACLSSQYPEIRSQALTQLYKIADKTINSSLEDREPIYILLGELIETYEHHQEAKATALPHIASCFATHALVVQQQPIHCLYPKLNRFLNKGPSWRASKLPNYWWQNTILSVPEEDDTYWKEAHWTLDWLVDALRAAEDMEIMRKSSVFEYAMSLYSSPAAGQRVKEKVLEMLWRATLLEGGSTTLVTRFGVLSWLKMVAGEKENGVLPQVVRKWILETCDRTKVEEWSGLSLEVL